MTGELWTIAIRPKSNRVLRFNGFGGHVERGREGCGLWGEICSVDSDGGGERVWNGMPNLILVGGIAIG